MAGELDVSSIGSKISSVGQNALSIASVFVIVLIALVIAIGLFFMIRWIRRYQYKVTIWDYTSTPARIVYDKGGFIKDRITKKTLFALRGFKIGLSSDHIPFINTEKGKEVHMIRTGQNEYRYKRLEELSTNERQDFMNSIGGEDITNAMNQFQRNLKLRNTTLISQLVLYAPIILCAGIFLVIIIISFKFLPDILGQMNGLAQTMKETWQQQCGTTILPVK